MLFDSCDDILNEKCVHFLNYEKCTTTVFSHEVNNKLIKFVLDRLERDESGRQTLPLMWNSANTHLLGNSFSLAKQIFLSNLRKLQ